MKQIIKNQLNRLKSNWRETDQSTRNRCVEQHTSQSVLGTNPAGCQGGIFTREHVRFPLVAY